MTHWRIISSSSLKEGNDMAHLLKLEMKKFRLLPNILFTLAAVLFSILFITVSLVDSMTDPSQTKDSFESTFLVKSAGFSPFLSHYCTCKKKQNTCSDSQKKISDISLIFLQLFFIAAFTFIRAELFFFLSRLSAICTFLHFNFLHNL